MDEKKYKNRLKTYFILGSATILFITIALVVILEYFIIQLGLFKTNELEDYGLLWIILFGVWSISLGLFLTFIFGRFILKPINKVVDGMAKLSRGDFSVRLDTEKTLSGQNLQQSFNSLAEELQNTELLRSDFVNNFSHELKTPIVSVSGLVELLKDDTLPVDKRKQYLEVIEEEVHRLSNMTTNILNLSKVENQVILTDVGRYNLSEQLRSCLVLQEKKWTKKELELILDFDEYDVLANEDMLRQVWTNLLDNAIKFSPQKGELKISVEKTDGELNVKIINDGQIPEQDKAYVFNKFHRGANSNKNEGNGIGLSIVEHIVKLHGGKVDFVSEAGKTEFIVTL